MFTDYYFPPYYMTHRHYTSLENHDHNSLNLDTALLRTYAHQMERICTSERKYWHMVSKLIDKFAVEIGRAIQSQC